MESSALYDLLENEIVPVFYGRQADGLPRAWIARMKTSMKLLSPVFSTNRMLYQYGEGYYRPAARGYERMSADGFASARAFAAWKAALVQQWPAVSVESVEAERPDAHRVGEGFMVSAFVRLGEIRPDEVAVELYHGPLSEKREITAARTTPMRLAATPEPGRHRFVGTIPCDRSGMQGYTVRVRPSHPDAGNLLATGLLTWR